MRGLELTLRTPVALDAITELKRSYPSLLVGAGTVLTPEQLRAAAEAGADFIVTPGTHRGPARSAERDLLPVVPGASTPSELLELAALGFRVAKLFPAAALGGITMLKALQGPLAEFQFCPTGGLGEADAPPTLRCQTSPASAAPGCSPRPNETAARAARCRALVDARKLK
jgi:2-dehydro-3-deoxyphosphogluconate aldolase/(4S)-4-hydroxy-2-oxoglutarate aldolase